jgi:hypothetical protein
MDKEPYITYLENVLKVFGKMVKDKILEKL